MSNKNIDEKVKSEKKQNKKINKSMIILPIINLLFFGLLIIFITKLQMIPFKFIVIISLILVIFDILILLLLKSKKKIFKIIGYIISFILIVISSISVYYIYKTNNFLDKAFSNYETISHTYYIVTSSNNNYTKNDIKGNISYINNFELSEVTDYLSDKFKLNYIESSSLSTLFNEVKIGTVNFMLIDKTSYNMALDLSTNLSNDDYNIVYEFTTKEKVEPKEEKISDKNTFTMFIVGSDFAGYNDLNLLVTVNLNTNKVLVTTIPRAYYIEVDGFNGKKNTLSFLAPYGVETSVKTIENYFKIDIDYYLKINTHSLVELVDQIGGITYCSDQAYYTTHSLVLDTYKDTKNKFYVSKGCQELNGIQTLTVARERLAFYDGDRTRQKNCVKIMQAILQKMVNTNTLINYDKVLGALADLYETDMPRSQIALVVKHILSSNSMLQVETQSVDGTETKDYVHFTDFKDYVIYPTETTVIDATAKINKFITEGN